MSDVVFFFKSSPTKAVQALDWPGDVKLIGVDPPSGMMCGGTDPRCSSAYSRMASGLTDSDGRILPNFLAHYAKGVNVDRVAFVGFSAAHGILNPLGKHPADVADTSAVLLLDATFGGGKTGYVEFGNAAVDGDLLLATTTSNTGGDDAWQPVWQNIIDATGATPKQVDAREPMTEPSGGVWRLGKSLLWYRFVDDRGKTELPHWEMGKILPDFLAATLVPYWQGKLGGFPWGPILGTAIAAGGAYAAWRLAKAR